jgi:CDP-6-deoxy-D-xylo-4-hexulose-3-dehydrase
MYAQHGGKFCGTIGKMGTYSSFFSHHICTIEGGITTTDDEELYQIMLSLRAHGWTRDLPNDNHVHNKTGIKSDDMFRFVLPGYNLRPNEIYAAIGLEQLKKLPTFINYRVHNYAYFKTKYAEFSAQYGDIFTLQKYNNGYYSLPSYFAITMTLKGKMDGKKTEFMEYLLSNNIECRPVVAGNFTKNPVIKHMPHEICGDMTNAENVDKNGLFIGNHSYDIKDKIDYFFEKLKDYVNRI